MFWPGESKPVFFVASRGHHADIGGITPGSMPPHSKCIQEEGAVFKSFKLVDQGIFQEEGNNHTFTDAMHIYLLVNVYSIYMSVKLKYFLLFFDMFIYIDILHNLYSYIVLYSC